jgi:hypothetical protein
MIPPSKSQLLAAYRALYRESLRAVQYSAPSRFILRDKLRNSFRKEPLHNFDQSRIDRTLEFMRGAALENGIEHKILRNLLHVGYWETFFQRDPRR